MLARLALVTSMVSIPGVAHAVWETREIAGMSVEIYTPASTSPIGDGRALMIPLHGCTQTAVQLRDHGNFEHTADELGVVIAIPLVPDGGVVAGCWNYYGSLHTRDSGHNGNLITLAQTLRDDAGLGIDAAQIYLAGFSAGGGQAMVVGCLAPELFAGVAVAAGPSLGTSVNQISSVSTTGDAAASVCTQLAGSNAAELATQLAITFTDTGDFTVAQGYQQVNADMFAISYGGGTPLSPVPFDMALLPGAMPAGMGNTYADADGPRLVSMVSTSGTGHAWPSGSGMPGLGLSFVSGTGVDFGRVVAQTFAMHSRRASGDFDPTDGGDDGAASGDDGADDTAGDDGEDDGTEGTSDGDANEGDDGDDGEATSASAGATAEYIEPTGCQCAATADPRRVGPGLAVVVIAALVSRRRSQRRDASPRA
jgi:poly(3-hydroxybutyrate) depolymerase